MWFGNKYTKDLSKWLQAIGFNVIPIFQNCQKGPSCGYIAVCIAWLLHKVSDWKSVIVHPNLKTNDILAYNIFLGTDSDKPQFLTDAQILELLSNFHNNDNSASTPFTWIECPTSIKLFILGIRQFLSAQKRITRKDAQLKIAIVNTTLASLPLTESIRGDHWHIILKYIKSKLV